MSELKVVGRNKAYLRRLRRRVTKLHGKVCLLCGGKARQMAHTFVTGLSGRGRGKKSRLLDALRNPHCYAPMCNVCHANYDYVEVPF